MREHYLIIGIADGVVPSFNCRSEFFILMIDGDLEINGAAVARTCKSHYIPSMIAFSVTLGRIAAAHLASSGK